MAVTLADFQIGLKYNLTILDPKLNPIFGARHDGVILTSILSYEDACKVTDIATSMANAAVTGIANVVEPKSETYLKFKTTLGSFLVLPIRYIGSVSRLTLYKASISLTNIADTDIDIIKNALVRLGYVDAVISKTPYDVSKESYADTSYRK